MKAGRRKGWRGAPPAAAPPAGPWLPRPACARPCSSLIAATAGRRVVKLCCCFASFHGASLAHCQWSCRAADAAAAAGGAAAGAIAGAAAATPKRFPWLSFTWSAVLQRLALPRRRTMRTTWKGRERRRTRGEIGGATGGASEEVTAQAASSSACTAALRPPRGSCCGRRLRAAAGAAAAAPGCPCRHGGRCLPSRGPLWLRHPPRLAPASPHVPAHPSLPTLSILPLGSSFGQLE